MTQNNLFPASQRGFMRGNSYTAQFLEFSDDVSQALDEGDNVDVLQTCSVKFLIGAYTSQTT